MSISRLSYSDQPTTFDELGFSRTAEALLEVINGSIVADTPLTLAIYGAWGSGKTSLMQMIQARLDRDKYLPIWFDAWRYAQTDSLWRALLVSLVEGLRNHLLGSGQDTKRATRLPWMKDQKPEEARKALNQRLDDLLGSLYRSVERQEPGSLEINWGAAGKAVTRAVFHLGAGLLPGTSHLVKIVESAQGQLGQGEDITSLLAAFQREQVKFYKEQVRSLEQFHQNFRALVDEYVVGSDLVLTIFIDDLDRCLPEQSLGVLEALKVFLDIPGCIFVLGMDRLIIEHGIRIHYKDFQMNATETAGKSLPMSGRDYLDKVIQVPFEMPPLEPRAITQFLMDRLGKFTGLDSHQNRHLAEVMSTGLPRNPRKVKRALNLFRLQWVLTRPYPSKVNPVYLVKLVVLQIAAQELYEKIGKDPLLLLDLEASARGKSASRAGEKSPFEAYPLVALTLSRSPYFEDLSKTDLAQIVFAPERDPQNT